MANILESLGLRLFVDNDDLVAGFEDSEKQAKKSGKEIGDGFGKTAQKGVSTLTKGMGKLVVAIGGVAAGMASVSKIWQGLASGAQAASLANRLQISVQSFTELSFAARQAGLDQKDFGDVLKDIAERVADAANAGGEYEEALNLIGLRGKELKDLALDEQFTEIIRALGGVSNAGDQAWAAMTLASDAGFKLVSMAAQGAEGLEEMRKQAREMGATLDDNTGRAALMAQNALRGLNQALDVAATKIAVELTPAILAFSKALPGIITGAASFAGVLQGVGRAGVIALEMVAALGRGLQTSVNLTVEGLKALTTIYKATLSSLWEATKVAAEGMGNIFEATWDLIVAHGREAFPELTKFIMDELAAISKGIDRALGDEVGKKFRRAGKDLDAFRTTAKDTGGAIMSVAQAQENLSAAFDEAPQKFNDAMATGLSTMEAFGGQIAQAKAQMMQAIAEAADSQNTFGDILADFDGFVVQMEGGFARISQAWQKMLTEGAAGEKKIAQLREVTALDVASTLTNIVKATAANMNAENEKAFERQKKWQIAAAIVDSIRGAVAAYQAAQSIEPPWGQIIGAANAAAALAFGYNNVRQIRSTRFGSSEPGLAGAGGGQASMPGGAQGAAEGAQAPVQQNVTNVSVSFMGRTRSEQQQVRDNLMAISDAQGDNMNLSFQG